MSQTNPKLAKAACPTCGVNTNDFCSNSWHLSHRGQEEAAEPRADGDEYTVTRRWLRKLRDCLRYSFEPGGNLPVAIGMVNHALTGCAPPPPDDACPISPQEWEAIARHLDNNSLPSLAKKIRVWLERGRV